MLFFVLLCEMALWALLFFELLLALLLLLFEALLLECANDLLLAFDLLDFDLLVLLCAVDLCDFAFLLLRDERLL